MSDYNLETALEQIKKCGFECEGGPLENNTGFRWLVAELEAAISRAEKAEGRADKWERRFCNEDERRAVAEVELSRVKAQLSEAEAKTKLANLAKGLAEGELEDTKAQLSDANREIEELQSGLAEVESENEDLKSQITNSREVLRDWGINNPQLEQALKEARKKMKPVTDETLGKAFRMISDLGLKTHSETLSGLLFECIENLSEMKDKCGHVAELQIKLDDANREVAMQKARTQYFSDVLDDLSAGRHTSTAQQHTPPNSVGDVLAASFTKIERLEEDLKLANLKLRWRRYPEERPSEHNAEDYILVITRHGTEMITELEAWHGEGADEERWNSKGVIRWLPVSGLKPEGFEQQIK